MLIMTEKGLRAILDSHDDAALHRLMTNLAGHDMASVLAAFHAVTDDALDRESPVVDPRHDIFDDRARPAVGRKFPRPGVFFPRRRHVNDPRA